MTTKRMSTNPRRSKPKPDRAAGGRDRAVAIVVLGCRPYLDDGCVNPELMARVGKAVELYQRGFGDVLLLSGGTTVSEIPEALVMKSMIKAVPKEALLLELHAKSTKENAILSRRVLLRRGIRDIILVTSQYHMPRALAIFRAEFAEGWSLRGVSADFHVRGWRGVLRWSTELAKRLFDL